MRGCLGGKPCSFKQSHITKLLQTIESNCVLAVAVLKNTAITVFVYWYKIVGNAYDCNPRLESVYKGYYNIRNTSKSH